MTVDQLELITAAVDGELSAIEDRAFRALVAASADARTLYAALKADSARVGALPCVPPPADLRTKVLARLAAASPALLARPKAPAPRRLPAWVPAALAASVLLCVSAGSFAFFAKQTAAPRTVAKNDWSDVLPAHHDSHSPLPSPHVAAAARPDPAAAARVDVLPVPPVPGPHVVPPEAVAVAPEPRSVVPNFVGSQLLPKLPPFTRVEARVPFLRPVADMAREDIRQELADDLKHDPAFKFDLFVRDTARGAEVFQAAAKAAGLTLLSDAATLDRLKKRQVHAVVVYIECLTAAELTSLFAKLATEDAKFSPRVCDALHATPVGRFDELELKAILGVDVGLFKRATAIPSGQGGEPKSVSAGTVDSVVKAVSAKPGEKPAVLLTWQTTPGNMPRTNPATSAELKHFLAKRGDRKPNVVPAIIVIRPVG